MKLKTVIKRVEPPFSKRGVREGHIEEQEIDLDLDLENHWKLESIDVKSSPNGVPILYTFKSTFSRSRY